MSDEIHPALAALKKALEDERNALLARNPECLIMANEDKLKALAEIEGNKLLPEMVEPFRDLQSLNQSNLLLLQRRRREMNWALKQLGLVEVSGTYTPNGTRNFNSHLRTFGVG